MSTEEACNEMFNVLQSIHSMFKKFNRIGELPKLADTNNSFYSHASTRTGQKKPGIFRK